MSIETLRVTAVLGFLHLGASFWTTASRLDWTGGNSATRMGSVLGLLLVGAAVTFGVVQVWRARRSGLVVLGLLYLASTAASIQQLYAGRGSWVGLALRAVIMAILWSPQAWRVAGRP